MDGWSRSKGVFQAVAAAQAGHHSGATTHRGGNLEWLEGPLHRAGRVRSLHFCHIEIRQAGTAEASVRAFHRELVTDGG